MLFLFFFRMLNEAENNFSRCPDWAEEGTERGKQMETINDILEIVE